MIAIITVGVALAAVLLPGQRSMRQNLIALRERITSLESRMARLEGLLEGYTQRPYALPLFEGSRRKDPTRSFFPLLQTKYLRTRKSS